MEQNSVPLEVIISGLKQSVITILKKSGYADFIQSRKPFGTLALLGKVMVSVESFPSNGKTLYKPKMVKTTRIEIQSLRRISFLNLKGKIRGILPLVKETFIP